MQHQLNGVQLGRGEIFVGAEEVFQIGDVAGEHGGFLKGAGDGYNGSFRRGGELPDSLIGKRDMGAASRCSGVRSSSSLTGSSSPILGLKRIDNVLPGEVIQITAA